MSETLWITIPTNEENALKNVINSIASKNLARLSIKQLIEKLENNQAADWIEVLAQYNAIPSVNNIGSSEILNRSKSVRDKFGQRGYPQLQDRQFAPRELLGLVILCYSNPVLIGPKLCKALNDNNNADVKKEMIENSAYRKSEDRVLPSQSNLRLLSTALYFNNTDISLPNSVIDRVTRETIRDGRIVRKLDQRGGFEELIDGPARARNAGVQGITHRKRDVSEIDSRHIWQSLKAESDIVREDHTQSQLGIPASTSQISYSSNGSELVTEALPLYATNNAASSINNENLAIAIVGFHIFRNLPVIPPIMRNIGKDLKSVGQCLGDFFSRNSESEQQEEITLLSPTARS